MLLIIIGDNKKKNVNSLSFDIKREHYYWWLGNKVNFNMLRFHTLKWIYDANPITSTLCVKMQHFYLVLNNRSNNFPP